MNLEQKDKWTDKLLIFMKNEIENQGANIKHITFNFAFPYIEQYLSNHSDEEIKGGEDFLSFQKQTNIINEDFDTVIKYSLTHEYLTYRGIGASNIMLTDKGMARAASKEKSQNYKYSSTSDVNFSGSINATHVNLQVGNNNIQNIENVIMHIINEIDKADCSLEEKKEAKNLLAKFLEHPITSGIISGSAVAGITKLLGV